MRVFHAYLNKSTWNCSLPSQKKICTLARAKNQMAFEYQNKLFDEFKHFSTLQFWLLFEYIFDKFSLTKQSCFLKMCLKILAKHWFLNLLLDIKIFVASSGGFRSKCNKERSWQNNQCFPKNKNWFRKCWKSLRLTSFHPSTCMTQLCLNQSFNNEIVE